MRSESAQFKPGHVYADWTGAALPPPALIDLHAETLKTQAWGNPHSHHAPSAAAMDEVLATRQAILDFFHADSAEYDVIFTSGATAAVKLVAENFRFEGGELLLTADNHNSVNGIREVAKARGAVTRYAPISDELEIDCDAFHRMLEYPRSNGNKLVAYPAMSNYTGNLHGVGCTTYAQERGWYVLLDAAAYVGNHLLDLSVHKPDFIPISFYKMFGYPTGLGALLIRKRAYDAMFKRGFAGGSILLVSVAKDFFAPETVSYARYEDGTVAFSAIPAIRNGLGFLAQMGDDRRVHAGRLGTRLYDALADTETSRASFRLLSQRGNSTVTFSVTVDGRPQDAWLFERAASAAGIYVRSGCFCNPGVNEKAFGYDVGEFERFWNDALRPENMTIEKLREYTGEKAIGAIRASFGYANDDSDIDRFIDFARQYLVGYSGTDDCGEPLQPHSRSAIDE